MKKSALYLFLAALFLVSISCHQKEKQPAKKFISIPSLIHEQIAHVDTSLYPIMKLVTDDSLHTDSSFIKREDFAKEAADFMVIPELSDKKVARQFREEPALYDESLNKVIIAYTPLDPNMEIKKLQILIDPAAAEGDNIHSIIATTVKSNKDQYLKKEMLWQIDKSFQVVTTSQYPGQPEKNVTVKVTWNEAPDQ